MLKVTKVLILLLLSFRTAAYGQQLSNQVIVPVAGLASAGAISYSQTIGETAVEIMNGSGFVLTQGFHQPGLSSTLDPAPPGSGVDVYPNPATDLIKIKLFGDVARKFKIDIINLTGTIISTTTMDFITKYYYIREIDISGLKYGFYFVRVISDDSAINRIFKIEKM
jgi:hypothetical protein